MSDFFGGDVWAFLVTTIVVVGGAGYLMGRAIALTWRPPWQILVYGTLLSLVDRFLIYALFGGELVSLRGLLIALAIILALAFFAYRITRARQMATQYPWLYKRSGLLGWQAVPGQDEK